MFTRWHSDFDRRLDQNVDSALQDSNELQVASIFPQGYTVPVVDRPSIGGAPRCGSSIGVDRLWQRCLLAGQVDFLSNFIASIDFYT